MPRVTESSFHPSTFYATLKGLPDDLSWAGGSKPYRLVGVSFLSTLVSFSQREGKEPFPPSKDTSGEESLEFILAWYNTILEGMSVRGKKELGEYITHLSREVRSPEENIPPAVLEMNYFKKLMHGKTGKGRFDQHAQHTLGSYLIEQLPRPLDEESPPAYALRVLGAYASAFRE